MLLEDQVGDRQHERVAGVHQHSPRLPRLVERLDSLTLEADAVVSLEHRLLLAAVAAGDPPVALADFVRNVGDLVAARLPGVDRPAEGGEGPHEERPHKERLETAGLRFFHFLLHGEEPLGSHRLLRQGVAAEKVF